VTQGQSQMRLYDLQKPSLSLEINRDISYRRQSAYDLWYHWML